MILTPRFSWCNCTYEYTEVQPKFKTYFVFCALPSVFLLCLIM